MTNGHEEKARKKELARLVNKSQALSAQLAGLTGRIEALTSDIAQSETVRVKKISTIKDRKEQVKAIDAGMREELEMLISKYLSPRTPRNLEEILRELLILLWKIIWKLFFLQGMQPPPIDPRLVDAEPFGGTAAGKK